MRKTYSVVATVDSLPVDHATAAQKEVRNSVENHAKRDCYGLPSQYSE